MSTLLRRTDIRYTILSFIIPRWMGGGAALIDPLGLYSCAHNRYVTSFTYGRTLAGRTVLIYKCKSFKANVNKFESTLLCLDDSHKIFHRSTINYRVINLSFEFIWIFESVCVCVCVSKLLNFPHFKRAREWSSDVLKL